MKDRVREEVSGIEGKKCEGIIIIIVTGCAECSRLLNHSPLRPGPRDEKREQRVGTQPAQTLAQALVSCFHLNNASCVSHKIQQESKQHTLLHVSLKNQQRQIPQIFVCPVDSCRILCLLRTLRLQQSQARQRGHQSNWDTDVCARMCMRLCVCVCVFLP